MERKIATLVLGILLIGIVSAGLVAYLSNVVTGTVTVNGPVFYAASEHNLLMNTFDNSTTVYDITDGHNEVFLSTSFPDSLSFYKPSMNMYVLARIASGDTPKNLKLEFGYFDSHGNLKEICDGTVEVTSNDFIVYNFPDCVGKSTLTNVKGFYYRITGDGTNEVTSEISVDGGNTRAEMNKA